MSGEADRGKLLGRRALLLGGGKAALLSVLVGRMYYLQVLEADKYATLADENRINLRLLPPSRGRILDRNGVPMAVNQQNYRLLVVSEQTDDLEDTLDALGAIIPISDHDRTRIIREIKRRRSFVPVTVRLKRDEGEAGLDLALTIDLDLQQFAAQRLGDESGSAVVIDIHTGEILVMASTPSFDPNAFNRGLSGDEWRALITNPRAPLTNKAIAGQYPPGSTFKLVTALAALECGAVTGDQRIVCPGQMNIGNITLHCWKKGGHGAMDMVSAIKNSCDVYFYEVARRAGFERIAEMAKRFGLGSSLGLDLPGERGGIVPNREWKRATLGQAWYPGETPINAIGQGYVQATPLQLAVMCARIANGGLAVTPHLARDMVEGIHASPRPDPDWPSMGLARQSLALVRRGMFAVCNEPGGTAFSVRIKEDAMAMSGKTGSAQVKRITMHERETGMKKMEDLPWKDRDHALFVAYAPESEPRYACCVVVEHGSHGGSAAGPVARDILVEVQKRYSPSAVHAGTDDPHWHDHG